MTDELQTLNEIYEGYLPAGPFDDARAELAVEILKIFIRHDAMGEAFDGDLTRCIVDGSHLNMLDIAAEIREAVSRL